MIQKIRLSNEKGSDFNISCVGCGFSTINRIYFDNVKKLGKEKYEALVMQRFRNELYNEGWDIEAALCPTCAQKEITKKRLKNKTVNPNYIP